MVAHLVEVSLHVLLVMRIHLEGAVHLGLVERLSLTIRELMMMVVMVWVVEVRVGAV